MKHPLLPLLVLAIGAILSPRPAAAAAIPVGVITYDYGVNGPNTAEFDIYNGTGPNSFDPDFPVSNSVSFSNLSLLVDYANGTTHTFGSSYFTLDGDGISFDGAPLVTTLGSPTGLNGAIEAILTGTLSTGNLVLDNGPVAHLNSTFTAYLAGSGTGGRIQDGDFALIQITPEPSSWIMAATGLLALFLLRRRPGIFSQGGVAAMLVAGSVLLLAAAPSAQAQVKLGASTSPSSGDSGVSAVNITGSGFPAGTIPAANVTATVAASCGAGGGATTATSVSKVTGSTYRVQFVIPASLSSGNYSVSLSGTTSTGTAFSSSNCAQLAVNGASPIANLSASSIAFPSVTAGSSDPVQTVTLSNPGSGTLTISSIAISGTGANLFTESDNCNGSVASGSFCTITAGFNPKQPASYSANITITDNASPTSQVVSLSGAATPFVLTINTTNAADWKINNGALSLDFNPSKGRIFGIHLAGFPDNLVDTTNGSAGIYMDNSGFGSGTATFGYDNAGTYLDWWVTTASNATNAYTYSTHFVVFPNDPGIHTYFVANHATTDIAGGIGQVQWVYRSNLNDFPNTYSVNPDLSNPGPVIVPLPPASENFSTDPGRAVSDATVDLHGFTLPAGFTREFYTKYDYSSYNYLHQGHGTFGSTYGTWGYFPSNESLVAGPTKQNLIFTGNLLILEAFSNHYDNNLSLATPAGTASSRLFGPFYIHFNTFGQAYNGTPINTPDDMYADAIQSGASLVPQYDNEHDLVAAGYIPSTNRGSVSVQINNVTGAPKTAWAVLSDPAKNIQFSSQGYQYWADISATGSATFNGVAPGTYRLSVYDLGQFGEYRQDGIVVTANQTTTVPAANFVPENFGGETVFTIGTPDRSSHEFLHGHDSAGHDDREFDAAWNYWADFSTNKGSVVYNATAVSTGPATNDLSQWNYNHWGVFDPGLFGGVYVSSDDTTDGYKYVIPGYVANLTGASGTNGVTTRVPAWTVRFASPQDVANYQYAVLSVAIACSEGSYVTAINNSTNNRTWSFTNPSDCAVRSGLSGYTQWVAFEYPASLLNPAGQDNVLTLSVSQSAGDMDDALRLELSNTGANPTVTGWHDYEYVPTRSTSNNVHANDALPNP